MTGQQIWPLFCTFGTLPLCSTLLLTQKASLLVQLLQGYIFSASSRGWLHYVWV